jgi:8-oxo-dGTP pyrophosphatase MutT (NUDIX family)
MERHLTVSGFVVHDGRVALHWHRKIRAWLPAGGHIEPGEDPLTATLREVREEFAVEAEPLPLARRVHYTGGPAQFEPPYTILDCWPEPDHGHVDLVYFLRLVSGYPGVSHEPDSPVLWFDIEELEAGSAPLEGVDIAFPPDVQALGIEAIRLAAEVQAPPLIPSSSGRGLG